MTAAAQNRMVKTAFECFIEFAQNASRILKSLSSFFHLFARPMGNVLRFIDDLIYCLFCAIGRVVDRKSTRLNSSHANISYAVFCLKKKNTETHIDYSRRGHAVYGARELIIRPR